MNNMMNSKIRTIALMYAAAGAIHQPPKTKSYNKFDVFKNYCNIVVERLANDGLCYVDNDYFERLYQVLPAKLRGQVLFHCNIEDKRVFITYTRVKK